MPGSTIFYVSYHGHHNIFLLLTPIQKKTFRKSIEQKQPFLKADLHLFFIWDGYNLIHVLFSQKYGVNFLFFSFFFFFFVTISFFLYFIFAVKTRN